MSVGVTEEPQYPPFDEVEMGITQLSGSPKYVRPEFVGVGGTIYAVYALFFSGFENGRRIMERKVNKLSPDLSAVLF